jgi:YHS domain-containing protein
MFLALSFAALSGHVAAQPVGQDPAPASGGVSPQLVTACVQSQQTVLTMADAANRRIESARQTNQPTAMRAAVDDLQAVISAMRTQLTSCAEIEPAAGTAGPHAGHTMAPSGSTSQQSKPAPPGAPVMQPGSPMPDPVPPSRAPAAAAPASSDPHAGHTMPPAASPSAPPAAARPGAAAPAAKPGAQAAKPGAAAPAAKPATPAADAHTGHAMSTPATSAAGTPGAAPQAVDPVCGLRVDPATAPSASYQGQTYQFCSDQHRLLFQKDAVKYLPKEKR